MDPVKILDHYRLPLVHSRDALQALARLLRDGPQNSADLAESLRSVPPETHRQLTSLYRAALVKKLAADLWSVSPLGEQLLDGLRVLELAAADLAESLADTEADRLFLRTWLRRPTRGRDSRACLSLIRSLHHAEGSESSRDDALPEYRSHTLYAIIIAADTWVQHAGVENVWEALTRGHTGGVLEAPGDEAGTSCDDETVAAGWQAGMKRYRDSNRLLLFIPDEPPAPTDQETVRFTWLRAVDAAMRGSADEGLRASCSRWQQYEASVFWQSMFNQRDVEQQTRVLCRQLGWLDQPSLPQELLADLSERLLKAIGATSPSEPHESGQVGAFLSGDEFHELIYRLQRASDRVEQEGAKVVPEDARRALGGALDHLSSVLRESGPDSP